MVRKLVDDTKDPGSYKVVWDSKDEKGRNVGAGIYFCKFTNNQLSDTRKMILVK